MTELSLVELLYTATQQVWPQAHEKNIELRVDEGMNELFDEAYVLTDGGMIVRALVNLLTNAIRYSPSDSVMEITLQVNNNQAICCIRDHGIGMTAAQLKQLNQGVNMLPAAHAKPDAAGSLSVGLIMAMTVVRHHQGQLTFHSELGLGTQVFFKLACDGD
ncbi:sensor histidine kinase [Formosimonas limnophila]|uniref:sensor histidine kinase n=1 Tax=Formosimonas limnophila TaxID=1384487 RepID=UPI0016743888|nr:HAMP domain-containing sensor histidine kinase [Formosimonas limnophila]